MVTLLTGFVYFIFNATYLKKRSQLEGNDIVKKKPKSVEALDKLEKQVASNDICLDEKPRCKEITEKVEENNVAECGIDNGGFLKESRDEKLSKEANERRLTQTEVVENAKNANKTD